MLTLILAMATLKTGLKQQISKKQQKEQSANVHAHKNCSVNK